MFKTYISEMAGFQFAGAELDMTESTVGDAFVGNTPCVPLSVYRSEGL